MEVLVPFRHKLVLFALLIPALMLTYTWLRRGGGVVMPFDFARGGRGNGWRRFLGLFESIPALLLGVVVLILAGPQKWDEPRAKKVLTNIEFCVDVSGSMTAKFGEGSRYDASMAAINDFLDDRSGDAFGLTFFGNSVMHWVPLTSDISAFRCAPPFMRPGQIPPWFGGTEIGKALMACRKVLNDREEGDRMIVLVSDGVSSDLGGGNDMELVKKLNEDGIVVFAVHIAESDPPDEIVNITRLSGGEVFNPGDQSALDRVFRHIDEMTPTRIEKTQAEAVDDYEPYALVGLVLLALSFLSAFGLRYTPW